MAAATALAIAGGISAAGGLAQTVSGISNTAKYNRAIENYQRTEIKNPYENLKVSTLGAMLQQENSAQNTASAMYNLRQSGANAVLGGTGSVVRENNKMNNQIGATLDQQFNANELAKAQGIEKQQNAIIKQEEADLAGLGTALNVSKQNTWSGLSALGQGATTIAGSGIFDAKPPTVSTPK